MTTGEALSLTKRQSEFLRWLLIGTRDATTDKGTFRLCENILKRLEGT